MPGKIYVLERKIHNEIIKIIFRNTGRINVAVSLPFVKNIPGHEGTRKSCKVHSN
jgi:hypothetical protein